MALSRANFPLDLDHRLYRSDGDHVAKGDDFFGVCLRYLTLTFMLGSHHLHIKSTFLYASTLLGWQQTCLPFLLTSLWTTAIRCLCYFEPLHFLDISMTTIPHRTDPLPPKDLFSHVAFPFYVTKCLKGKAASRSRAHRTVGDISVHTCL